MTELNTLTARILNIDNKEKATAIVIIFEKILNELEKAEEKHPSWPSDVVHAAAILGEESGEVLKAAIDFHYSTGNYDTLLNNLDNELMQTGAMVLRMLLDINNYINNNDKTFIEQEAKQYKDEHHEIYVKKALNRKRPYGWVFR